MLTAMATVTRTLTLHGVLSLEQMHLSMNPYSGQMLTGMATEIISLD